MESDRLAHELTIDPMFRLPQSKATIDIDVAIMQSTSIEIRNFAFLQLSPSSVSEVRETTHAVVKRRVLEALAERIMLASKDDPPNFLPTIQCFDDLRMKILSFSPKAGTKKGPLLALASIDLSLFNQMLSNGAVSVTELEDWLFALLNALGELVAPARVARLSQWKLKFTEKCSDLTRSSSMQSNKRQIEIVLPLIPLFFEITALFIEELQRDMANHYLAVLAPSLYRTGAAYLAVKVLKAVDTLTEAV